MMTPTQLYHRSVYDEQLSDIVMENIIEGLFPKSDFEVQIKNICGFLFGQIKELKSELKVHDHDLKRDEQLIVESEHYLETDTLNVAEFEQSESESTSYINNRKTCDENEGSVSSDGNPVGDAKRDVNYQYVIDTEKESGNHHDSECSCCEIKVEEDKIKLEPLETVKEHDQSVVITAIPPVLLPLEIDGQSQNVITPHQPVPAELSSKTEVTMNDPHVHKCSVCDKSFAQMSDLTRHKMRIHYIGERRYKCTVCGKGFIYNSQVTKHMRTHTGERPYKCFVCCKGFITNNQATIHMRTHSGERPYKCSMCDKGFTQNISLTAHMRTHAGERPHKCFLCGKGFIKKSNCKRHMMIHTGERPFKCSVCGKGFTQKHHITIHMCTHTGEKTHKCSTCGKGFLQKSDLTKHNVIHTGERPYKCSVCGEGFIDNSNLTRHNMIAHTGERPHKCSVCDKRFTEKGTLTVHMRTHTGKRPYKCSVCGKEFTQGGNLARHIMRTHDLGQELQSSQLH